MIVRPHRHDFCDPPHIPRPISDVVGRLVAVPIYAWMPTTEYSRSAKQEQCRVPDDSMFMFMFSDPKFMGKSYLLE